MNVLFIGRGKLKSGLTGDSTQLRRTMDEVAKRGCCVKFAGVGAGGFVTEDGGDISVETMKRMIAEADVLHVFLIAPAVFARIALWAGRKPICLSTVYWMGWERFVLALMNEQGFGKKIRRCLYFLRTACPFLMNYRGASLLLPNSMQEGVCVRRHFSLSPKSRVLPVVNAFDIPSFSIEDLPRPSWLPQGDYIVYPGVFASRKNQSRFIVACRGLGIPIVFLGGVGASEEYLEHCKHLATEEMIFAGFLPSSSSEYWAVLSHARCACLVSDCETPGIALLEASYAGARPVVTRNGGTASYYGGCAEYCNPCSVNSIRSAVKQAWNRGRLSEYDRGAFGVYSWCRCADQTLEAYTLAMKGV